jgi:hypothetical protein
VAYEVLERSHLRTASECSSSKESSSKAAVKQKKNGYRVSEVAGNQQQSSKDVGIA